MIFDSYRSQDILCLDEYNSQIPITAMNGILDGYPLMLPSRYFDRVACYTKVYIISNLPLKQQYRAEQQFYPDVYNAFIRRIHKVMQFMYDGSKRVYNTQDYLKNAKKFKTLPKDYPTPWNTKENKPEFEQTEITAEIEETDNE